MNQSLPEAKNGCERILSRAEVAQRCRVTTRAVNKWVRQGILKPIRLPGRKQALGYRETDIETLLTPKA